MLWSVCGLALFQTRPLHFVRPIGEQGVYERHQERFNSVEFGRGDGAVMREIVDDAP
jgi:hypothetical protein